MAEQGPIPYEDDVRAADTARAAKTLSAALFPDDTAPVAIDFGGCCPRCGDPIEERRWIVTVAGSLKMNDRQMQELAAQLDKLGIDRSSGDETFDLVCSCAVAHPNAPEHARGCGAHFRVRVEWP